MHRSSPVSILLVALVISAWLTSLSANAFAMQPSSARDHVDSPILGTSRVGEAAPAADGRGVFVSTGLFPTIWECPTATTLADGRVLVVGGWGDTVPPKAELFDPGTGSFASAGSLLHPYAAHTATLLGDGRVLISGSTSMGDGDGPDGELAAEVWDPETMTSSPTGAPLIPAWSCMGPQNNRTRVLPDGRILIESLVGRQVWDPTTGAFSLGDEPSVPRDPLGSVLADGRVLTINETEARVWDPETHTSHPAGRLSTPRRYGYYTATLLADGRVLIVGGEDSGRDPLAEAEIWDPATERFTRAASPLVPRSRHAAALLHDGRVLIVGSHTPGLGFPDAGTRTAELFAP